MSTVCCNWRPALLLMLLLAPQLAQVHLLLLLVHGLPLADAERIVDDDSG